MRYNKMHNVNTILNNKAQLSVFLSSCKISLWFQSVDCHLLPVEDFHEVVVEDFLSSSNVWELGG